MKPANRLISHCRNRQKEGKWFVLGHPESSAFIIEIMLVYSTSSNLLGKVIFIINLTCTKEMVSLPACRPNWHLTCQTLIPDQQMMTSRWWPKTLEQQMMTKIIILDYNTKVLGAREGWRYTLLKVGFPRRQTPRQSLMCRMLIPPGEGWEAGVKWGRAPSPTTHWMWAVQKP